MVRDAVDNRRQALRKGKKWLRQHYRRGGAGSGRTGGKSRLYHLRGWTYKIMYWIKPKKRNSHRDRTGKTGRRPTNGGEGLEGGTADSNPSIKA